MFTYQSYKYTVVDKNGNTVGLYEEDGDSSTCDGILTVYAGAKVIYLKINRQMIYNKEYKLEFSHGI